MNLEHVASERVFVRLVCHRHGPPVRVGHCRQAMAAIGAHRTAQFDRHKTLERGIEDEFERAFGLRSRMSGAIGFPTVVPLRTFYVQNTASA